MNEEISEIPLVAFGKGWDLVKAPIFGEAPVRVKEWLAGDAADRVVWVIRIAVL